MSTHEPQGILGSKRCLKMIGFPVMSDICNWSLMPPGRQRQADLCESKAGLVYRVSSRTAKATPRNPVSKNLTQPKPPKQNQ